ncbi:uncharacterized protein LOC134340238 isoform X2 [Mobula hypostoma]|uniref:uncharacterized protein LOC134340238 isoform X2 n=1 Tax=Mobula hypostoma TaxID=723540 RepID=UPI002FC2E371
MSMHTGGHRVHTHTQEIAVPPPPHTRWRSPCPQHTGDRRVHTQGECCVHRGTLYSCVQTHRTGDRRVHGHIGLCHVCTCKRSPILKRSSHLLACARTHVISLIVKSAHTQQSAACANTEAIAPSTYTQEIGVSIYTQGITVATLTAGLCVHIHTGDRRVHAHRTLPYTPVQGRTTCPHSQCTESTHKEIEEYARTKSPRVQTHRITPHPCTQKITMSTDTQIAVFPPPHTQINNSIYKQKITLPTPTGGSPCLRTQEIAVFPHTYETTVSTHNETAHPQMHKKLSCPITQEIVASTNIQEICGHTNTGDSQVRMHRRSLCPCTQKFALSPHTWEVVMPTLTRIQ